MKKKGAGGGGGGGAERNHLVSYLQTVHETLQTNSNSQGGALTGSHNSMM